MATIRQKQSTYAITISTFQQHRHFQRAANAELFISMLFQQRDRARFELHGFVVMPDHIHVLITPAINESTAKCIQYIKGGYPFAARQQTSEKSGTAVTTNTEFETTLTSRINLFTSGIIRPGSSTKAIHTSTPSISTASTQSQIISSTIKTTSSH